MAEEIRAEMVGNVLTVDVSEGEAVAKGDTVIILESMKTESAGVVRSLTVQVGDVVQEHDLIAVVE